MNTKGRCAWLRSRSAGTLAAVLLVMVFHPPVLSSAGLSVVQAQQNFNANSGVTSITATITTTAGNLLVAFVREGANTSDNFTVSDSAGQIWTQAGGYNSFNSTNRSGMFYMANSAAVTSVTAKFTTTGGIVRAGIVVYEISGAAASSPVNAGPVNTTGSSPTSITSGPLSTASSNDILIFAVDVSANQSGTHNSFVAGTGFAFSAAGSATNTRQAVAYKIVSSTQSNLATSMSWGTAAANSSSRFIAFKGASATSTPPCLQSVGVSPVSVTGGQPSTGTVTLTSAAPSGGISVSLSSSNAAAQVSSPVTVPANATSVTFNITTSPVSASTPVTISASYNGVTKNTTLTVTPPPALQSVSVNPASVTGGQGSTGTVTLTSAAPSGGISVSLSSNNAAAKVLPSVTIQANNATATFTITTSAVSATTPVTISASYNGVTRTATLTLAAPPVSTYALSVSTSSNRSNALALQGAKLSASVYVFTSYSSNLQNYDPSGISKVCYWLDNPSLTGAATHCESFMPYDFAGSLDNTATSLANPWNTTQVADGTHTITQLVSESTGATETDTASFTVSNGPSLLSVSVSPSSLTGGQGSTGTVTLTGAPSSSVSVSLSSNNAAAKVTSPVIVSANATSATFSITTTAVTATTPVTISATYNGVTRTATLNLLTASIISGHFEYVFPDQNMYVYDLDNNFQLVKHISIPQAQGIRGVGAVLSTHMLYISYGQFGGNNVSVPGSLLKYDLLTDSVVWTASYPFGVDSFAITPDGSTIYMPDGEKSGNGIWYIIDPAAGNVTGSINTNMNGPHNTIVSLDGAYVFMGPRHSSYLVEGSTSSNSPVLNIGLLKQDVRPFTINGRHNLAFTTATGFLGFQVSSITTGAVLYTVPVPGFSIPSGFFLDTPCHGISLSPDEKEIYLIDTGNAYVHVFDVSGLPSAAPTLAAHIPLTTTFTGSESPCLYDCEHEGWIRHSRDGRFVFVGDSGNVIDTGTRQVIATLAQLRNTRKFIEIDWLNGSPVSTTTRHGLGYVTQ